MTWASAEEQNPKPEKNTESNYLTEENIPINAGVNQIKNARKTKPKKLTKNAVP